MINLKWIICLVVGHEFEKEHTKINNPWGRPR
jgi:hypothetical protein